MRNVKNWFLIPCAYFLDVQKRIAEKKAETAAQEN